MIEMAEERGFEPLRLTTYKLSKRAS